MSPEAQKVASDARQGGVIKQILNGPLGLTEYFYSRDWVIAQVICAADGANYDKRRHYST
jgi:hypothetical protein